MGVRGCLQRCWGGLRVACPSRGTGSERDRLFLEQGGGGASILFVGFGPSQEPRPGQAGGSLAAAADPGQGLTASGRPFPQATREVTNSARMSSSCLVGLPEGVPSRSRVLPGRPLHSEQLAAFPERLLQPERPRRWQKTLARLEPTERPRPRPPFPARDYATNESLREGKGKRAAGGACRRWEELAKKEGEAPRGSEERPPVARAALPAWKSSGAAKEAWACALLDARNSLRKNCGSWPRSSRPASTPKSKSSPPLLPGCLIS